MEWEIEVTDEFNHWWESHDVSTQDSIATAVSVLERVRPSLGRPRVDTIHSSRHSNMKELRPVHGNIRVLFAFDPRRMAILRIGGDKSRQWNEWYDEMVPVADRLYDDHLAQLRLEGLI